MMDMVWILSVIDTMGLPEPEAQRIRDAFAFAAARLPMDRSAVERSRMQAEIGMLRQRAKTAERATATERRKFFRIMKKIRKARAQ